MNPRFRLLSLFASFPFALFAQDSLSLRQHLLQNSTWGLYHRQYFMSTLNEGNLSDAYAYAAGLGVYYKSPEIKGFSLTFKGFFHQNLASSDLQALDSLSQSPNRYEVGLMDVQDLSRKQFARNEELYLQYHWAKKEGESSREIFRMRLGRMVLNTPFLNPQDGRMAPTSESGVEITYNPHKQWTLQGHYLWGMAPRSSTKWMRIGESMGVYPSGRQEDGSLSAYAGQVNTEGLVIGKVGWEHSKALKVDLHNYHILNVLNVAFLEIQGKIKLHKGHHLIYGAQGFRQDGAGQGGNEQANLRYVDPKHQSQGASFRIGHQIGKAWTYHVNYTHIDKSGRWLFPREWGRDPFYTFLPRERNEGLGASNAWSAQVIYKQKHWGFNLGYGRYYLQPTNDFSLNKYAMNSYGHVFTRLNWTPKGWLEGFDLSLIHVYKHVIGDTPSNPRLVYNKINMHHINVVLNYAIGTKAVNGCCL